MALRLVKVAKELNVTADNERKIETTDSTVEPNSATDNQPQKIPESSVDSLPNEASKEAPVKTANPNNDVRTLSLCGDKPDIAVSSDLNEFYTDDSFFLSSLKDAIRLARQCQQGVLLNFPQARIYVLALPFSLDQVFWVIRLEQTEALKSK